MVDVLRAVYVPPRKTPLTQTDALWAIRIAFERLELRVPTAETLAILVAQSAFETGHWKSMWCYSFGNAKASPKYEGHFTSFRCSEVEDGAEWFYSPDGTESCKALDIVRKPIDYPVPPGHPQTRFRAYLDAASGAVAHLAIVRSGWPTAWAAALAGDALGFCAGLIENPNKKYYTASPALYRRNVVALTKKMAAAIERDPRVVAGPPIPKSEPPTAPPLARPTLRKGDRGPHVFDLQAALNTHGMALKVDGHFGPGTEAAVQVFQHEHHLTPDGIVGAATQKALNGE